MSEHDTAPTGVLLMAYGTQSGRDGVEPYYTDVRGGRAPTPELLAELKERYRLGGGRTALVEISRAQADGLQRLLDAEAPGRYRVYLGMKHWHPYIAAAVRQMRADGIRQALAVALAPHYSRLSIGGYISRIEDAQASLDGEPIRFRYVESWHDEPIFLEALATQVRAALATSFAPEERDSVFVLFTPHSLPERIREWDDPYQRELLATSRGVADLLGLPANRWDFPFQRAGRTPEPWLGPDILTKLRELAAAGPRPALPCPPRLLSEPLEIFLPSHSQTRRRARA